MKIGCIFALTICGVFGQTWDRRARLSDFNVYFTETIQHLTHELEKREWCNLKIADNTVALNERMYRWHVAGNVTYANGFLISIQRIDLTNINFRFGSRTVNGTVEVTGSVLGTINLRDPRVGYDVIFNPEGDSEQRYTGVFEYRLISYIATISKNFHTGEITSTIENTNISPGIIRMIFLPANNVTEVISRNSYVPSSIRPSIQQWGREIMNPIVNEFVTTKKEFPRICFVNC